MARKKLAKKAAAPAHEQKTPGMIERAESHILGVSSKIGYPRLHQWMLSFLRPSEALAILPEKPQPAQVAWNLLVFYFIFYLLFVAVTSLVLLPAGGAAALLSAPKQNFADPQAIFAVLVLEPIADTAAMLLTLFLLYVCVRLASGKAGYWRLACAVSNAFCGWMALLSVIFVAATLVSSLALVFPPFTTIGALVAAAAGLAALVLAGAGLLVFAWGAYSALRMVKAASGFSYLRAGLCLLLTLVLMVILNVLAVLVMTKLGV